MQVARILEHGGPEAIRVDDVDPPSPDDLGPQDVLVRVLAVSVNHLDLWVRGGMPGVEIPMPRILGCDGTGEVLATGAEVDDLAPGARVVLEPGFSSGKSAHDLAGNDHLSADYGIRGEHTDGFAREQVVLERRLLTPLPAGVDPVAAAAVPLVFVTAWGLVVTRANVRSGETVLVLGGASGVGSAAIQIARTLGAHVIATAGSAEKRALALELGAEHAIDHRAEGWAKDVKELTGGRGADVVVEHVGPATWDGSMRALARNGRLVTCGATTGPKVSILLPHLFIKNLSVLGSTMGPRSAFPEIFARVASGEWRPVVDRVMPLAEIARAHALLEERKVAGKIVLIPGNEKE
jgi:NADPH2:quinone reductase